MKDALVPTLILIIAAAFVGCLVGFVIPAVGPSAGTGWGCLAGLVLGAGYWLSIRGK